MLNVGLSVYRKEDWSKVTYIGVSLLWPRQAIRTTLNFKLLRADPDSRQHLGISLLIPVLQLITFFMKPFSFLHLWNWNLKEDFICSKLKRLVYSQKGQIFQVSKRISFNFVNLIRTQTSAQDNTKLENKRTVLMSTTSESKWNKNTHLKMCSLQNFQLF